MSLLTDIQNCAEKNFNINTVKPFQMLVIHRILEQSDLDEQFSQIVVLPTGSGKSLCFMIPAVMCKTITIIVYPLLALMNDQTEKLKKLNIDCVNLRGGQTKEERRAVFDKLRNGTKIVITNPETLNQQHIINRLKQFKIGLFVVDEAHVISQWGKSFRPAYAQLKQSVHSLNPQQILAFTATATEQTVTDIKEYLFTTEPLIVHADSDRDNIYYSAYPVYSKMQGVCDILSFCKRPAIIFCNRRDLTREIAMQLTRIYPLFKIRYYHAGLSKIERQTIEQWFRDTNGAVLVTTCAYGLGVDLPGIRTVIHYDLPEDALEYLQESGRVGRDRQPSSAWVLVPQNDSANDGLISIFKTNSCRRQSLLSCLGEYKEECSGCDVCTNQIILHPYGYAEVLSLTKRYPFKYSTKDIVGILCGSPFYTKEKLNPYYGIIKTDPLLLSESVKQMDLRLCRRKKKNP